MKRLFSRLVWIAIQVAIVAIFIQVAYDEAARTGQPVKFGLALIVGVLAAITVTVVYALIADGVKRLWWSLSRSHKPDVGETSHQRDRLRAGHINRGETLKLTGGARIGKEPR